MVSGNTALIASGKPFRPSTTAIRMPAMPRFLSSFCTLSQNLAPSVCSIQMPSTLLRAVRLDAQRDVHRLIADEPLVADLYTERVKEHQRIAGVERATLPFGDRLQHGVGNRRDQIRRHVDAVKLFEMPPNLAHRHAARVHRDDPVVEVGETALVFGDQLRIERPRAIPRHVQRHLRRARQHRLSRRAVAPVDCACGAFIFQMIVQLR